MKIPQNLLKETIKETIKAWQQEETEDEYQSLNVDKGNIDTFINEVYESVELFLKPFIQIEKEQSTTQNTIDWQQECFQAENKVIELQGINEELKQCIKHLALSINALVLK